MAEQLTEAQVRAWVWSFLEEFELRIVSEAGSSFFLRTTRLTHILWVVMSEHWHYLTYLRIFTMRTSLQISSRRDWRTFSWWSSFVWSSLPSFLPFRLLTCSFFVDSNNDYVNRLPNSRKSLNCLIWKIPDFVRPVIWDTLWEVLAWWLVKMNWERLSIM